MAKAMKRGQQGLPPWVLRIISAAPTIRKRSLAKRSQQKEKVLDETP
jgi:hypothetical protein